jgi:hypothetical protein
MGTGYGFERRPMRGNNGGLCGRRAHGSDCYSKKQNEESREGTWHHTTLSRNDFLLCNNIILTVL